MYKYMYQYIILNPSRIPLPISFVRDFIKVLCHCRYMCTKNEESINLFVTQMIVYCSVTEKKFLKY